MPFARRLPAFAVLATRCACPQLTHCTSTRIATGSPAVVTLWPRFESSRRAPRALGHTHTHTQMVGTEDLGRTIEGA